MPGTATRATLVLSLTQYIKTAEGVALIASQRLFAYEGRLWKGYQGACIRVLDWQPVPSEFDECLDMDGSLQGIISERKSKEALQQRRVDQELLEREGAKAKARMDGLQAVKMERDLGLDGADLKTLLTGDHDDRLETPPAEVPPADTAPVDEEDQFRVPPGLHPELTAVPEIEEAQVNERTNEKLDALINSQTTMNKTLAALVDTLTVRDLQEQNVPVAVEAEPEETHPAAGPGVQCEACGKRPPQGHKNPDGWLRGHGMAKHKKRLA